MMMFGTIFYKRFYKVYFLHTLFWNFIDYSSISFNHPNYKTNHSERNNKLIKRLKMIASCYMLCKYS